MSEFHEARSWTKPIVWGIAFGLFQAFSPRAFFWLEPVVVWALSVALIAAVDIGVAVAAGRPVVGHGIKDSWQQRTHFVANTRWCPPFCLVVDFVAAAVIALEIFAAGG